MLGAYLQVENCKLRDYEGDYERFLEKNEAEAEVIAEKEAKKKEIEKSQIKAKSKVFLLFGHHSAASFISGQAAVLTSLSRAPLMNTWQGSSGI